MVPTLIEGDLLDQDVDVIVNAWNRNIIPWWLLLPQGVSGAIKKRGGTAPFRELARHGAIPLGGAVLTSAGNLPFKGIIHVAGINLLWFATRNSIQRSIWSGMNLVNDHGFESVAFPIIGSGSGNRSREVALPYMLDAFMTVQTRSRVLVVKYGKPVQPSCR
jgi:O-acetyl-ADP-ribose deacetylase